MTVRSPAARLYEPNEPIPGTVYRVIKLLAQGGMGNVYDVEDVTVGKRYVLKTLTPELVGRTDLTRRMDAEARVLARLSHPNIVEVITAGTTADSLALPFLVMERLYGQSLRTVLDKRGAVEFPYACKVAIDLLDALEHAHDHGVIHRDVKPENVFLHRTSFGVTVTKLLDFGVMRLKASNLRETEGRFVGTLRYAAPEQLTAQTITPAADIYAAGLVLYEMLCGRGPFDDEETSAKVAKAHVTREAPRASTFVELPPGVDELLHRALSKLPAERPADAFSFAAELRKYASPGRARGAPESSASTSAHPMPALSVSSVSSDKSPGELASGATSTAKDSVAEPTEVLTSASEDPAPLNRAATVAASSPPGPLPAVLIDRGAPTRSMVVESELPLAPGSTGDAKAALKRTAPLVPTPVPALPAPNQDFQFPKETGVVASTEPATVSARRPSGTTRLAWILSGVVVAVALFGAVAFAFSRGRGWSGTVAARAAQAAHSVPMPTATSPVATADPAAIAPSTALPAGTALATVMSPPPVPEPLAAPSKPVKPVGSGRKAAPQGPSRATVSGSSTGNTRLPGIDF